jgi:hypothetical protein
VVRTVFALKPTIADSSSQQQNALPSACSTKDEVDVLRSMAALSTSSAACLFLRCSSQLQRYLPRFRNPLFTRQHTRRLFHSSGRLGVVKPFLLADVGEGELMRRL